MHSFIVGTALLAALNGAYAKTLEFDCSKIPNVCENMCWGVKCAGNNQKYATLTWDKPDPRTKRDRRTGAGCLPSPNRCSTKGGFPAMSYNCDEFPFASVKEADDGGQFSRCTPSLENHITPCWSQGAVLAKFFREQCKTPPCTFNVAFSNYPSGSYCEIGSDWRTKCKNDLRAFDSPAGTNLEKQQEYQNGAPAKDPSRKRPPPSSDGVAAEDTVADDAAMQSHHYRLASGRVVTAFSKLNIGESIVSYVANANCTAANTTTSLFGRASMIDQEYDEVDAQDRFQFTDSMLNTVEEQIVEEVDQPSSGSEPRQARTIMF